KAIPQKAVGTDFKPGFPVDLNVIPDLHQNLNTSAAFGDSGSFGYRSHFGSAVKNLGVFQHTTAVGKLYGDQIIGLIELPQTTESNDENGNSHQSKKKKGPDFDFQIFVFHNFISIHRTKRPHPTLPKFPEQTFSPEGP